MAPDNGPVTKADLDAATSSIRELIENELRHQAQDIAEVREWRDRFTAEDGPWRMMDKRVSALEYLARSIKWIVAALTPIAAWAIMEIIKAGIAWIQG